MAKDLRVSFNKFLENISLSNNQSEIAEKRAIAISELLNKNFTMLEVFPIGSLISGTSLKNYADVDVMIILHYSKHIKGKTPTKLLQDVRDVLSDYNTKMAKKNGQAATLYFKTWPNVDIVPASRCTKSDKFSHYDIPNMNDNTWISSNPKKHIKKMQQLPLNKIKLILMIKEWNRKHSSLLSSFHIENLALTYGDVTDDFSWELFKFFEHISDELKYILPNPNGLGSNVDDYLSKIDRENITKRIDTALSICHDAWYESYSNKNQKYSIEEYNRCFGERFPSYG